MAMAVQCTVKAPLGAKRQRGGTQSRVKRGCVARPRGGPVRVEAKESRIGKQAVLLPQQVEYTLKDGELEVSGPKGTLRQPWPRELEIEEKEEQGYRALRLHRGAETKKANQFHGLFRSLAQNMVTGVNEGWERKLTMVGVGYRAAKEEDELVLSVGYANNVRRRIPDDLECTVDKNAADITIRGIDKQRVGDFAARVRSAKPPEPYKGKGIRYSDEKITLKEGKKSK